MDEISAFFSNVETQWWVFLGIVLLVGSFRRITVKNRRARSGSVGSNLVCDRSEDAAVRLDNEVSDTSAPNKVEDLVSWHPHLVELHRNGQLKVGSGKQVIFNRGEPLLKDLRSGEILDQVRGESGAGQSS